MPDFENATGAGEVIPLTCFRGGATTSSGLWLGDNPFGYTLPLLIFQLAAVYLITSLTHAVLRHLSQPLAISQIISGILMGPFFLSRIPAFSRLIAAPRVRDQVDVLSIFALMLFLFMIGVKTDVSMIRRAGSKAFTIAAVGSFLPFCTLMFSGTLLSSGALQEGASAGGFLLLFVSYKWSLTSYTVLSCVLAEMNLLTSKLGRLAMSAALIGDFVNQLLSAMFTAWVLGSKLGRPFMGIASFSLFLAFLAFIFLVVRPIVMWMVRQTPEGSPLEEAHFLGVVLLTIICGLLSEFMGYHASTGPFILGLMLPGGPPLGVTVVDRLDRLNNALFLPLFFATAGYRTDVAFLRNVREWALLETFLFICVAAKFVGVVLPCLYCRMPTRDAVAVGLMMISKGVYEVDIANIWRQNQMISHGVFSMMMLTIVAVGGGTAALVKMIYRPEDRFVAYKRRTVQHMKAGDELRILACAHNQDNVWPLLALLEGTYPTKEQPVCVYLLHLIQLAGRCATVLTPYKKDKGRRSEAPTATETDHIVNAFAHAEEKHGESMSVTPYICISPFASMHDDICSLALDKKASLILLHFPKHVAADGTVEAVTPAIQAMNVNVLRYAPCSVAIVVDQLGLRAGPPPRDGLLQRVVVYFLGGPDDREAVAFGRRLAGHPHFGVTVVRFRLHNDVGGGESLEEKLDDQAIEEFRSQCTDGRRVVYREEVVRDGEGTVGVIRSMSEHYSLLVVGRREGKESPLTEGLSVWSEYPELGVIGDMLASTDFGGRVSTFVVQQQRRFAGVRPSSLQLTNGSTAAPKNEDDDDD